MPKRRAVVADLEDKVVEGGVEGKGDVLGSLELEVLKPSALFRRPMVP